ncbi:hypothetical protein V6Z11_A09G084900 [Gossypium hirsutum]
MSCQSRYLGKSASVLFDEYSINVQYGLSEVPDEHPQLVKIVTVEGINQVLQDLGVEGTNLTVSQNDCYIIDRVSLKPHCRVRYHFIKSHLSLSTHNSFISEEHMLLLHCFMTERKINVGKIIFREVHRCAQKNVGTLNSPSLITALYQ